jgi:hypothetical protein
MECAAILRDQVGVISRAQALACGYDANTLRRLLRRRVLVAVHPGVYVDHTGEPSWIQLAWAAVLFAWPAALTHESSLRAFDGPGKDTGTLIHVAVGRDRRLRAPAGVRIHRTTHLEDRVLWNLGPPRTRYEDASIDVAVATGTDIDAIAVLAAAVGARRTTARRMAERLETRLRSPRRAWIAGVLEDVASGTCSVLEHAYLARVERPHGLPRAERQERATATTGVVYRDARHGSQVIELDGRLGHGDARQRDRDLDRDLDAAVDGLHTVRLGYGQVFDRPCLTARRVAILLQQRGWTGRPRACAPTCPLGGAWVSAGDTQAPPRRTAG